MQSRINCVALTTLHENFLTTIESVNAQSLLPNKRFLIIDGKFSERFPKYSDNEVLAGWEIVMLSLGDDFGDYRNRAVDVVPKGEWICFLDDDEWIHQEFFKNLDGFVGSVKGPLDAIRIPRSNSYGLNVNERPEQDWLKPEGYLFPDWQGRVLINNGRTKYVGVVHEVLSGYACMVDLHAPYVLLIHHKTRQMQSERNEQWGRLSEIATESIDPIIATTKSFYSQCREDYFFSSLILRFGDKISRVVVEIGAGHPVNLSNSRWLILNGFRALLVEGNPILCQQLSDEYQNNENVEVANQVVTGDGRNVDFHMSKIHWALSGVGGVSQSDRHGVTDIEVVTKASKRVSELINFWNSGNLQIGILSIDIEGLEDEIADDVLSNTAYRPTFIVIDTLSDLERKKQEALLVGHNYTYLKNLQLSNVWIDSAFDGLLDVVDFSRSFDPYN